MHLHSGISGHKTVSSNTVNTHDEDQGAPALSLHRTQGIAWLLTARHYIEHCAQRTHIILYCSGFKYKMSRGHVCFWFSDMKLMVSSALGIGRTTGRERKREGVTLGRTVHGVKPQTWCGKRL